MAKHSNLIKLGDAISQLLKQEHLDEKIGWKDVVGEMIARNTSEVSFREKTIIVTLSNAALKEELSYRKEELIKNINTFCGSRLVDSIIIR